MIEPPHESVLAPPPPSLATTSVAAALLAARLVDREAPESASPWARAGAAATNALLAVVPLVAVAARRRARGGAIDGPWRRWRSGALAALALSFAAMAAGLLLRSATATPQPFDSPRAPWPVEPLVAAAALLFAAQLLPFPRTAGATLLELAARASRPQLVAARLAGRVGGALLAAAAVVLALLPDGGDRWSWALAAGYALAALREERLVFRDALAREWALHHAGAFGLPGARALAPAQFEPFRAAAERAYAAVARTRARKAKPIASAASSTPTEAA